MFQFCKQYACRFLQRSPNYHIQIFLSIASVKWFIDPFIHSCFGIRALLPSYGRLFFFRWFFMARINVHDIMELLSICILLEATIKCNFRVISLSLESNVQLIVYGHMQRQTTAQEKKPHSNINRWWKYEKY